MQSGKQPDSLITDKSAHEYFQDSVSDALNNQRVQASQDTVYYVVNLLATYIRSEQLFDQTPDGVILKPLGIFMQRRWRARRPRNSIGHCASSAT